MLGEELKFDREASDAVARRVRAQFRRCWRNAALAVGLLGDGAYYVEGWIVTAGSRPFVIEHGWCEAGGRVIDPTYTPYVSTHEPPSAYFAGIRYAPWRAEGAVARGGRLPIAWAHESHRYRAAFDTAWRHATFRHVRGTLPPTRVVHCRREPADVFIGRPSQWANPFHIGQDGNREYVVTKYRRWLMRQPAQLRDVWTLRGKTLGCRCAPLPCHGDVLAALANVALERVNGHAQLEPIEEAFEEDRSADAAPLFAPGNAATIGAEP